MNSVTEYMPRMLFGQELDEKLAIYPEYDENIRTKSIPERLIALQDMFQLFIPNEMSREIYTKMYMAMLRSLQKKASILAVRQSNENAKRIRSSSYESIIGGSDSFTIFGESGIGKSGAISRASRLFPEIREFGDDKKTIIPCLVVQAPADCSVKGLLFEILRRVDEELGSNYYENTMKARSTIDMLIGCVSQVALNNIAILILDEIQNVVINKNGQTIVATLTQLINNSGVSIIMVGTPESELFFERELMLARRSIGLNYSAMNYDDEFKEFCRTLLEYCYVQNKPTVDESMLMWLYNHSQGNRSILMGLIHDAQEIAILSGSEQINIETLNRAYKKRLKTLHSHIESKPHKMPPTKPKQEKPPAVATHFSSENKVSIFDISAKAKKAKVDVIAELIKNSISVLEVPI